MNEYEYEPEQGINVGSTWRQVAPKVEVIDGKVQLKDLIREVEIIAEPTLSSPVGYRIVRNDAHPHRAGKTASARVVDFRGKYELVTA